MEYWLRAKVPPGRSYHKVHAKTKAAAIRKFRKGTRLTRSQIHVRKHRPPVGSGVNVYRVKRRGKRR